VTNFKSKDLILVLLIFSSVLIGQTKNVEIVVNADTSIDKALYEDLLKEYLQKWDEEITIISVNKPFRYYSYRLELGKIEGEIIYYLYEKYTEDGISISMGDGKLSEGLFASNTISTFFVLNELSKEIWTNIYLCNNTLWGHEAGDFLINAARDGY